MERIRIDTGASTPQSSGGTAWVTASSVTRYCTVVPITPAQAVQRYDCELDGVVRYEFRFNGRQTIGLSTSRLVWVTNGHPNYLKIYKVKSSPVNLGGAAGVTVVMGEYTGTSEEEEEDE